MLQNFFCGRWQLQELILRKCMRSTNLMWYKVVPMKHENLSYESLKIFRSSMCSFSTACNRSAHRDCLKGVDRCSAMQPQSESFCTLVVQHVPVHACYISIIYYCAVPYFLCTVPPAASMHRPIAASLSTGAGSRPSRRYPTPLANATDSSSKGGRSIYH